jgi:uncharacterized protein YutE (UPF0331/DUF86 family)
MTPRALDAAPVREKLRLLEEPLDALALVGEVTADRLQSDVVTRLAVERILTQAVDLVVSVCSHVASAEGPKVPTTYRDAIIDAATAGLIDDDLAASLGAAVGLRDVLVHEYARVDLGRVAAAVPVAARDLSAFVRQVAGWLVERP